MPAPWLQRLVLLLPATQRGSGAVSASSPVAPLGSGEASEHPLDNC